MRHDILKKKKNTCKQHKPNKWLINFLSGLIWVTSNVIIVALNHYEACLLGHSQKKKSSPVRKKYLWFQNLEQAVLTWKMWIESFAAIYGQIKKLIGLRDIILEQWWDWN